MILNCCNFKNNKSWESGWLFFHFTGPESWKRVVSRHFTKQNKNYHLRTKLRKYMFFTLNFKNILNSLTLMDGCEDKRNPCRDLSYPSETVRHRHTPKTPFMILETFPVLRWAPNHDGVWAHKSRKVLVQNFSLGVFMAPRYLIGNTDLEHSHTEHFCGNSALWKDSLVAPKSLKLKTKIQHYFQNTRIFLFY